MLLGGENSQMLEMIRIGESVNSVLDVVSRGLLWIQVSCFLVGHKRIPGYCCELKRGDWESRNIREYLAGSV